MTTATQTFTYANDGRLIKSVAADGIVTHWFYYPAKGGKGPSIADYLDKAWSAEVPSLLAPTIADGAPRLLMAEFQYQPIEFERVILNFTLYGYPDKPSPGMATTPDKLLTLEGADIPTLANSASVNDETFDMRISRVTSWDQMFIRYQTTEEIRGAADGKPGSAIDKTVVTERRYWGAEKTVLITTETREWNAEQGLKVSLASRNADKGGADVILTRELRSPYSGRVLRFLQDKQQHRLRYDGLGRITADTAYTDDSALNDNAGRTDKKLSEVSIAYEDAEGGTRVTTVDKAQPGARRQRTLYDGLQRPVRSELQRVAGDDVSSTNFCVTQNRGQMLDYLPGGLQRRLDQSVMPSDDRDWFWAGDKEQEQTAPANAVSQLRTERTLASARGIRLIREEIQTPLKDGRTQHSSVDRMPQGAGGGSARSRVKTDKTFDWLGRLIELKQTSVEPSEPERVFKISYDDLGRASAWTAPDGTRVKRTYSGMSDQVTQLSVQENTTAKEIILGSQTVGMPARVSKRVIGKRNFQLEYTTEGHFTGVQMPDSTRLFSEESGDGSQVTYKAETLDKDGKKKIISTLAAFSYDPLQQAIKASRPAMPPDQQLATDVSGSAPSLLGSSQYRRATSGLVFNALLQRSLLGEDYGTEHGSGSQVVAYRDRLNRRTRVRRGSFEYYYRYNAYGECEGETVRNLQTGHTLAVGHELDGFGQEVCRRYLLNGKEVEVYEQAWSSSGQLLGKTLKRDGKLCRSERLSYDLRGRLKNWTVDEGATDGPSDTGGKPVRSQEYQYDLLSNLTASVTMYTDGSKRQQTYSYSADNPTQRTKAVTVDTPAPGKDGKTGNPTRAEAVLNYDANGNLILDDQGRVLRYTLSGRLQSVTAKDGKTLITRYEYDERDRLIVQWDEKAQQRRVLIYSGDQLCGEVWLDSAQREVKRLRLDEEAGLVIQRITPAGQQTVFTLSDPLSGTSSEYIADVGGTFQRSSVCFTPWGECASGACDMLNSVLGFNGVRRDPLMGFYHLGNGYRVYNPSLRVFQQPDSWSPFGAGGLNDYAYCSGDPVNLFDPDGHLMISRWGEAQLMTRLDQLIQDMIPQKPPQQQVDTQDSLISTIIWSAVGVLVAGAVVLLAVPTGGLSLVAAGVLLGVTLVSSGLSIASVALQNSNPDLAEKLGTAALGIDLVSMIIPVKAVLGAGARMMRWVGSKVGQVARRVGFALENASRRFGKSFSRPDAALPSIAQNERAAAFGDIFAKTVVKKVPDPRAHLRWYQETISTPGMGDRHIWGANIAISGADLQDPIQKIARRSSVSDVHFYSGVHGHSTGGNWLDYIPKGGKATVIRNPGLDAPTFFIEDMTAMHTNNPFPNRKIHIHPLDSLSALETLNVFEKAPGHHIYAFCYARNDERFLSVYNKASVISYAKPEPFNAFG